MLKHSQIAAIAERKKHASPFDEILRGLPKNADLHKQAVAFARTRPGLEFNSNRLAKELKITPQHADKIGDRMVKAGNVTRSRSKGKSLWTPIVGDLEGPDPIE